MPPPPLHSAPDKFAAILHALGWAVAQQTGWGLPLHLISVIVNRIQRIKRRFAALAERIAAGTYKPREPAAAPRGKPANPPKPPPPNPLPSAPGWLLPLDRNAVQYRGHLEYLFREPEMIALMAAAPEAMARVLRPLCRMLALDMPSVLAKPTPGIPACAAPPPDPPQPAPIVEPPAPPPQPPPVQPPWVAPMRPQPALTLEYDFWGKARLVWN